jgi:glycosyltransferase involved in cell wall biosynthesis
VRILLINWQDRLNPMAGGAETHLHEVFGRLVRQAHAVTLLCSGWPGALEREEVDGMEVHRVGRRYTFGLHAPGAGRRLLGRRHFDVVVEALNKVPTFAPTWTRSPVVLLVHHLFGTSAFQEAHLPLATATWLLERPLPRFYRGLPVQAISRSTADDLVQRGLRARDIRVIYPGLDHGFFSPGADDARAADPTFVYVGRLRRYKRVDLIIRSLVPLKARFPALRLLIAGRGEWEMRLRDLAGRLGVAECVEFLGFVSEERKRELLRSAWANVLVSPKEGWGITNVEAAACGTATVASDAPGLRESVVHERTGLLVPHGDVNSLAEALARLAADRSLVEQLGRQAADFAARFTWDRAAEQTEAHLLEACGGETATTSWSDTTAHGKGG